MSRSAMSLRVAVVPSRAMHDELIPLGWDDALEAAWTSAAGPTARHQPRHVRHASTAGWSTVLHRTRGPAAQGAQHRGRRRRRRLGGPLADGERVDLVLPRRTAFTRRASFEGCRAESHTIAANIDVVFLVHALTSPPNQRRLERELVLAFDSGADPVVVLTKPDLVDDGPAAQWPRSQDVALGVPVHAARAAARRRTRDAPFATQATTTPWRCSVRAASASPRSSTRSSAGTAQRTATSATAISAVVIRRSPAEL